MQVTGQLTQVAVGPIASGRHGAQVTAEAELAPRARQHNRAHGRIAAARHGRGQQIHCHLEVERIGAVRPIERHQRNRAAGLNLNTGGGHRCLYSSGAIVTRRPESSWVNSI